MKDTYKEFFSELAGTFTMMLLGLGVVAMAVVFEGNKGNFESITWAWGFAVIFGILVGNYSGAHLNPAVSVALAATNRFPWHKVPHYVLAQVLGAFLAALVVFIDYYNPVSYTHLTLPTID
jgi:glycerol uptake facilitator-like aquaporin